MRANKIFITDDMGFFATCSATLFALFSLDNMDCRPEIYWNEQERHRNPGQEGNLFPHFFSQEKKPDYLFAKAANLVSVNGIYANFDFTRINPYIKHFFGLSPEAERKKKYLKNKYSIDPSKTIGLYYRGTDKWIEIAPINIFYYIEKAKEIMAKEKGLRLMVQTDQKQIRDICLKEFGKKAFFIEELPVTSGGKGIHFLSEAERGILNFNLSLTFLAAVKLLSECKYVVTCTGHTGCWICLLRQGAAGITQLHPSFLGSLKDNSKAFWPRMQPLEDKNNPAGERFRLNFLEIIKMEISNFPERFFRILGWFGQLLKK